MPLCARCRKPFLCTCHDSKPEVLGAVSAECSDKKPGAVWVHVTDDTGIDVRAVDATNDGGPKPTDPNGLAVFDPVSVGAHTVDLKPLNADLLKLYEPLTGTTAKPAPVTSGQITYVSYQLARRPSLRVKVIEKGGPKLFGKATVTLGGAQADTKNTGDNSGLADHGKVKVGDYTIKVKLDEEDEKTHATTLDFTTTHAATTLTAGQDGEVIVEAEPLNFVKPKIEMEYKVVLLNRKLSDHQAGTEKKLLPDATYIQVSATQTNKAHPFAKTGTLEVTPANVDIFTDQNCTDPFNRPLTAAELVGAESPKKLWLRGKTPGKFKVKLTLADPADRFVKRDANPVEEEMGVVEVQAQVHWYVRSDLDNLTANPDVEPVANYHTALVNLALPDQKALTDQQKVATGRLLHVQATGTKDQDRAKLLVKKLVADQWPAGTDDYKIVLNTDATSGEITLFDAQIDGAEKAPPHSIDKATLLANDVTLWVEGKTACKVARDVVLDVGIDRAAGGLAKTAKRRGDWSRYTPVEIKEVKLEYVQEARADKAWDATRKRYYININQNDDANGRKIQISAKLTERIDGVPICLMLVPDKDNTKAANWNIDFPNNARQFNVTGVNTVVAAGDIKWKDVPADLKHKDKADRQKLMHVGGNTDAEGFMKHDVSLSRFGGDKFHPAAYIEQDPHLAKYVDNHAQLGTRKPKFAAVTPIQVWRKVYYQATHPTASALPGMGGFDTNQGRVFLEPDQVNALPMTAASFTNDPFRPDWQYNPGGSNAAKLCIGTHNVDDAMKLFVAATKANTPKFHLVMCDEQFDARGVETDSQTIVFQGAQNAARDITMTSATVAANKLTIFDPPLQGGNLIVTGTWVAEADDTALITRRVTRVVRHRGTLDAGNVTLQQGRAAKNIVRVAPPATCGGRAGGCPCGGSPTAIRIDATHLVTVTLKLQAANGGFNGWTPRGHPATVVKGGRADYAVHNTMGHELGHAFGKVRYDHVAGWPDHPLYYEKRGGQGTHCAYNAAWTPDGTAAPLNPATAGSKDAQGKGAGKWDNGDCTIFGYGVDRNRPWCPHCALDMIFSDLTRFR